MVTLDPFYLSTESVVPGGAAATPPRVRPMLKGLVLLLWLLLAALLYLTAPPPPPLPRYELSVQGDDVTLDEEEGLFRHTGTAACVGEGYESI